MDPWRPIQRSFYNYWGEGQGYVHIFVHSAPAAVEPQRVDRAHVMLYQQNRSFVVGAPAFVEREGFLTPPIRESWFEDLQALGSFEQTVAAQAITAYIRSVPHLRDFVQDYFINVIANEARDAAQTAASLQHRTAWVIIDLNITIHLGYNGPGDDGVDDDDDGLDDDDDGGDDDGGDDDGLDDDDDGGDDDGGDDDGGDDDDDGGDDDDDDGGSYVDETDEEGGDAEVDPAAPEEVGADVEVQQLAAPEVVVGEAEVQQLAVPEGVVGDAAMVEAAFGDIGLEWLMGDPPGDSDEYVDLETVLTRLLGQPVAPFLEAAGRMRGLSPSAIAYHLTVETYMGESPQTCSICLEDIVNGIQAGWLPCSHIFHPPCISDWLDRNAVCPICRLKLSNNIGN